MTASRYPLSWPVGWPRSRPSDRKRASFSRVVKGYSQSLQATVSMGNKPLTMFDAIKRLQAELERLGATDELLSTNIETRLDGMPRSGQAAPKDPGAACYFKLKGKDTVLACDRWDRVEDNVAAIAQHIDALRRIDRYGVGTMAQAFAGYAALPPKGGDTNWRAVLGFEASMNHITREQVIARHRDLARNHHPDAGGDPETMARLNAARDTALAELG